MDERKPERLNYVKRGAPEQRSESDPYHSAADKWFLVIIASLLVFGGVMFLGVYIIFAWGWDTPIIKVRFA